jgi:DNA topoisomerase-1
MRKHLVIVESPAKARTVNRYLGQDFLVSASMGHVRDLPKSKLGVDVQHDFTPEYKILPERMDLVLRLRQTAESCDEVYLAADPDREGEAICWHLSELLEGHNDKIFRVLFHEITKKGIEDQRRTGLRKNRSPADQAHTGSFGRIPDQPAIVEKDRARFERREGSVHCVAIDLRA